MSGRITRVVAFLLSLLVPGAGHFLVGAFRRGVAWAVGVTVLGLAALFTLPVSLVTFVAGAAVTLIARVAAAVDATRVPARRASWTMILIAWGALLAAAVVFAVFVDDPLRDYYRSHDAQAFTNRSGAMEPTLLVGDYIIADKAVYRSRPPRRGDIVVFRYPLDERRDFIKRVVGLPGEQVLIRGRQVHVNGNPLREPYVAADSQAAMDRAVCSYAYGCQPTTVPADSYFLLGDNRDNSQDSRYWGFVKREKITGRATTVYWSWDAGNHWPRFDRIGRRMEEGR